MPDLLTCPACRSAQRRRRGDPLCPSCARSAAGPVPDPLWALDSPLLRRALAKANMPAVLAVTRAACGLSQRDMAAVAGWTPAALSCYERGRRDGVFDIRVLFQFADAFGMPRAALLPLILADPDAAGGSAGRRGPAVRAGHGLHCWRAGGQVPAWEAAVTVAPAGAVRGTAGGARLRYWQSCTRVLYARDRQVGAGVLLCPALLLWQQVRAASTLGHTDRALRAVAAGAALCAGRFALDCGSPIQAGSLLEAARGLASSADDLMLDVHVMLAWSRLRAWAAASAGGREPAGQALHLARQAAQEARYLPVPQLHALIAVHQAAAASLLGDRLVFETAITRARRELGRARPGDCADLPAWVRDVDGALITAAEADGALSLGDPERAAGLYREALGIAACPRDRAAWTAGLAHALQGSPSPARTAAAPRYVRRGPVPQSRRWPPSQ